MSGKPSLYVVEKREVVVLVCLFVLVTVLAFTLGVKYGETVGKKIAFQEMQAKEEISDQTTTGGILKSGEEKNAEVGTKKEHEEEKAKEPVHESKEEAAEGHGGEHKAEHKVEHAEAHGDVHSPEVKAMKKDEGHGDRQLEVKQDVNSDEHLLHALQEAGIESPAKINKNLPKVAKASPKAVRLPKAGSFVIQVGSYPTRKDAEQQFKRLEESSLEGTILPPVRDSQGEWYRVVLGSYGTKVEAEREARKLKEKSVIKSYFIRKL